MCNVVIEEEYIFKNFQIYYIFVYINNMFIIIGICAGIGYSYNLFFSIIIFFYLKHMSSFLNSIFIQYTGNKYISI